ncbi:hypothetical protein REPUB_Repub16aG0129800 [Reevesia pubescens]
MVTTVFVNNIPPKVIWRWLGKVFQRFGRVVDVFKPRRNSKRGNRIDFFRFATLEEARKAQWNLNGVWFLDHKIGVNIARFNPRKSFCRRTDAEVGRDELSRSIPEGPIQDQVQNGIKKYSQVLIQGGNKQRSSM